MRASGTSSLGGLGWYLGVDVRGCGCVWVSEGEIPRMGSPWAWGKIGECVGVRVGCRERKTASELCAVVRGGRRTRRRLLSLQKGESIYLARSLGGFVVLVQAQGLFFFIPFLARLARLAQFFFFLVGRHGKWGIFAIMEAPGLVRMR